MIQQTLYLAEEGIELRAPSNRTDRLLFRTGALLQPWQPHIADSMLGMPDYLHMLQNWGRTRWWALNRLRMSMGAFVAAAAAGKRWRLSLGPVGSWSYQCRVFLDPVDPLRAEPHGAELIAGY